MPKFQESETHKVRPMMDAQVFDQIQRMIRAIGQPYADCRKQMLWQVANKSNLPVSRINSLFYGKAVKPSAVDYLSLQMALDAEAAKARSKLNNLKERISVPAMDGSCPDGTGELFSRSWTADHGSARQPQEN